MKFTGDKISLSASDLSTYMACPYATYLNLQQCKGILTAPVNINSALSALRKKGEEFEAAYLSQLKNEGKTVVEINKKDKKKAKWDTLKAIAAGADVIYQARFENDIWNGWADFLLKVNSKSNLGEWSYEVIDTKLSKETKAGAILQICLYSEMLKEIQGVMPEHMHIYNPNGKHQYRVDDFMAYFRFMKNKLVQAVKVNEEQTYPEPVPHCDICNWFELCNKRRRDDDHLCFIAGMGRLQMQEVKERDITTLEKMAEAHEHILFKPNRGSVDTYKRLAHQAHLQVKTRTTKVAVFKILPLEKDFGFFNLPEPSPHDMFFDFEGDPFVEPNGLEYLFGWQYQNIYYDLWAKNEAEEKQALQTFMYTVMKILKEDPNMHIYHFGAYEQTALKRLVGKYATKEDELDVLLRGKVFINLHTITHRAIIAGIESYSLKDLEKLHGYLRDVDLKTVGHHKYLYEGLLESGSVDAVDEETKNIVRDYNKDDCISTEHLRDWLEAQREKLIKAGNDIPRPVADENEANEKIKAYQERIQPLFDVLIENVPFEKANRDAEQQAKWLLANMLDWYRREEKSIWWEYFRLKELSDDDLIDEKASISKLVYTGRQESIARSAISYYNYPEQDFEIKPGKSVKYRGESAGTIVSFNNADQVVALKRGIKLKDKHPTHIVSIDYIDSVEKEEAIIRLAESVIRKGIDGDGSYRAGRDLLLRNHPRTIDLYSLKTDAQELAIEWVTKLNNGVLPVQGPPGTGKSHTAANMILALIREGNKIGITALSHKVISTLLEKVLAAAKKENVNVQIVQKVGEELADNSDPGWIKTEDNDAVGDLLKNGYNIAAGTSFMWARANFFEAVDHLFVDEAGQLSLIDTIAISHAGKNLILLGDPQQLKQPQKGSHPEGTEVSALEHILQGEKTILPEKGVFLDRTWRMHPAISNFISELFYDGKLESNQENKNQCLEGDTKFKTPGIYFEPVKHYGNQNRSDEEVERVKKIVYELLSSKVNWINTKGKKEKLCAENIKIISPYNAQVNALKASLPEIQIGTVDKFQGQEATIIILSMATSSPEDAPRGMEFLYSLNRLNVAVSRAKAVFILVASPALFEPECRSPHQMQLANALCRLRELSLNYDR